MKPVTSSDFDRAYSAPVTAWGDVRIPPELKALIQQDSPRRALELGCGLGRFSRYVARQGIDATGIDFSAVAIAQAKQRVAQDEKRPDFQVGDVTKLEGIVGPFDFSFDVGCFHCLDANAQRAYATQVHRLLKPGGTHLIWALDDPPGEVEISPAAMARVFTGFALKDSRTSRRRLVASHWYTLVRER